MDIVLNQLTKRRHLVYPPNFKYDDVNLKVLYVYIREVRNEEKRLFIKILYPVVLTLTYHHTFKTFKSMHKIVIKTKK